MTTRSRARLPLRVLVSTTLLAVLAISGCGEKWTYYSLREVQSDLPGLMDSQWSRRREFTEAEMLAVRAGGSQTVLVARLSKPPIYNDVAQMNDQVVRTFIVVLDGPVQAGKTYHVTPENGRIIEGTAFRPAWRPYRGIEGDVTVLSASANSIRAAVRVSSLLLKPSDPEQSLRGVHTFKTASGHEPELRQAQINFEGGLPAEFPAEDGQ